MKNYKELQVTSYVLRVISNKLRATSDKLRVGVITALLFLLGFGTAMAQERDFKNRTFYENWELSNLFWDLKQNFSQTYLIRQTNDWIIYDLNYWFTSEKDRQARQLLPDHIFAKLDKLKTLRKFTESIEEKGKYYRKYTLTTQSAQEGQIDFVTLEVGDNKVSFQYKANADVNGKRLPVSMPKANEIKEKMETLYRPYIARKNTREQQVNYDWNLRKYHRSIAADNTTKVTRATRYSIPACTQKEYEAVVRHFQQIQQQHNVFMATNDVFWEYEETAIAFRDDDGRLHTYGVALKPDGTLYLIESHAGALPRLWAEDNAVWEDNVRKRPHYRTPENEK